MGNKGGGFFKKKGVSPGKGGFPKKGELKKRGICQKREKKVRGKKEKKP